MTIFCANPKAQYLSYQQEINAAIHKVLESGNYILGENVQAFEKYFSEYIGVKHTAGVASGTDALVVALLALGVGQDDEVILPSHTAVPTVAAVSIVGATPVFADVDKEYYTITPEQIEIRITHKTKAIIAVHLYGQAAGIDEIKEVANRYRLYLVEDCAQAFGSEYKNRKLGSIGDVGCFSFFPTKNLGAIGDAGAVVCNDDNFINKIKKVRQYGWDEQRIIHIKGINSRLDELQAAIINIKLKYAYEDLNKRRLLANNYTSAFKNLPVTVPSERKESIHSYHLYVIQCTERDQLKSFLSSKNIYAGIHYPLAVHQMPYYSVNDNNHELSCTDKIVKRILSIPIYPELTNDEQNIIINEIHNYFE